MDSNELRNTQKLDSVKLKERRSVERNPKQEHLPSTLDRRQVLCRAAGAAGLAVPIVMNMPAAWRRPVIDSVFLPAHAQTSCPPVLGSATTSKGAKDHDECLVITLVAGLAEVTAELRTPSGTVVPALSLAAMQLGGCCNAIGHTVATTSIVVNLPAPAAPVTLTNGSATVTTAGNFTISITTPVAPVLPITDIVDVVIDLNCDGEAPTTLVITGAEITSASATTPPPIGCSI